MKLLKKFTQTIVRKYHSPQANSKGNGRRKSVDDAEEDEHAGHLHGHKSDWERSQKSSGLIETQEEVDLDI